MAHDISKTKQVMELMFVGTVFVGLGAVLNAHAPLFHRPVKILDGALKQGNDRLASIPVAGVVFRQNPLTGNDRIREFLAVNAMETVMIGGICVAGGGLLKLIGITPHRLEEMLRRLERNHHPPDR